MNNKNMDAGSKRIKYFDTLKFFAIAGVLFLHCFNVINPLMIKSINVYDFHQLGRFGVPLFLCISGALLLNRKNYDFISFLKKRFVRICYPLIFFIIIAYILKLYENPLTAFWYCWMILGVYLTIPFINKIVLNSTIREIEYFLLICTFTSIFYQLMINLNIWFSLDLNFFISPVTYLILGYYLSQKEFNMDSNKIVLISLIVFIITSILKMNFGNSFDIYPTIKIMYCPLDFSILQILQCSSIFLLIRFIYNDVSGKLLSIKKFLEKESINNIILSVSKSSYGMYLVHMLFMIGIIRPMFKLLEFSHSKMALIFLVTFIILFIVSWAITLILSKIPYIKNFSGYA